jgi:hypothetical protein
MNNTKRSNTSFSIEIQTRFTSNPRRSPLSLPHLISGMKNEFLTHFYSKNYEMKLESGNEPHLSRVLYIGPSKRLNDYYALWPNTLKMINVG